MSDLLKRIPENIEKETIDILKKETIKIKIWDKCFEYDNFEDRELITLLQEYSKNNGIEFEISEKEIHELREKKYNNNIANLVVNKTGRFSKKQFGQLIGNFIANEIKSGKRDRAIIDILDDVIKFAELT